MRVTDLSPIAYCHQLMSGRQQKRRPRENVGECAYGNRTKMYRSIQEPTMAAIAPTAKKLYGDAPKSPQCTGILLCHFLNSRLQNEPISVSIRLVQPFSRLYTARMYSKYYERVICSASDKRCADFSLKMHQKRLAADSRAPPADPLGELTALHQAP